MGYVTLFSHAAFSGHNTVFSVSRGGETAGSVARNSSGVSGFGGETAGSVASSFGGSSSGSSSGGCSFSAIA